MTDEQMYEAQPRKDFKFNMYDENVRVEYRDVVVPNWIAADGRWGDVHNALMAAGNRNFATATEKIVKVLERAREYGRLEAQLGRQPEGLPVPEGEITANPNLGPDFPRSYRGMRRPFDPGLRDYPNRGDQG